jgi:N-methylhydantoinase A
MSLDEVATGIIAITAANMANAIRSVTVQEGYDPREAVLVAFGGAGPLFATELVRELGVRRAIVPPHPGIFSAWGLLTQDIVDTATSMVMRPLGVASLDSARCAVRSLLDSLHRTNATQYVGGPMAEPRVEEAALDLRYVGQEYTITLRFNSAAELVQLDPRALRGLFAREYGRTFGHSMDEAIEVVAARATLRTRLSKPQFRLGTQPPARVAKLKARAYSFTQKGRCEFPLLERGSLRPCQRVRGPLIIEEPTATTYVDEGFDVLVDDTSSLLIQPDG